MENLQNVKAKISEVMAKETSKDMAKFVVGGTSTLVAAKLLTAGCYAFSITLVLSLMIIVGIAFGMINRK